ncbi:MAG: hypothetical protein JXQ66_06975 [Campylobacterales bacterium]|nr:hypothetical protein [Campylobacterales bacterium]
MDIVLLIKSGLGLLVVLAILVFLLISPNKKKKRKKQIQSKPKENFSTDLKELIKIVKNKETDTVKLSKTVDTILKYHGKIPEKLGIRTHPEYILYDDIIFALCRHPNVTSNIVLDFISGLEKKT